MNLNSILIKTWRNRGKNLHDSYNSLDDIIKHCDDIFKVNYATAFLAIGKVLLIRPILIKDEDSIHTSRDCIVFRKKEDTWNKVDTKKLIAILVERLKEHVSVEKIIEDALNDANPDTINELFERIVEENATIKEEEGCYKLVIGGRGKIPFEFMLRE